MTTVQQCILHNLFSVGPSQAMYILDSVKVLVLQTLEQKALWKAEHFRVPKCLVTECRSSGLRSGFCGEHWIFFPDAVTQEYSSLTIQDWAYIMQTASAQFPPLPRFVEEKVVPAAPLARPVRHVRKYTVRKPTVPKPPPPSKMPQHPVTRCGDAGGKTQQGRPCPYMVYGGMQKCHLHNTVSATMSGPTSPPSPVPFTRFSGIPPLDLGGVASATTPPILPHRDFSRDDA
jgi:hypothetical protein